jgi:hypothetical protein
MGMLKSAGWYSVEVCGHELAKSETNSQAIAFSAQSCCEDETEWLQTNETIIAKKAFAVNQTVFFDVFPVDPLRSLEANTIFPKTYRGPPGQSACNSQALLQVFRM